MWLERLILQVVEKYTYYPDVLEHSRVLPKNYDFQLQNIPVSPYTNYQYMNVPVLPDIGTPTCSFQKFVLIYSIISPKSSQVSNYHILLGL